MQMGSGAWMSPGKNKKEEKEIIELHPSPFLRSFYIFYHTFLKSQGKNCCGIG